MAFHISQHLPCYGLLSLSKEASHQARDGHRAQAVWSQLQSAHLGQLAALWKVTLDQSWWLGLCSVAKDSGREGGAQVFPKIKWPLVGTGIVSSKG